MIVTYDAQADAAYIYLKSSAQGRKVARMYPCDPVEVGGIVNLDFDDRGVLIGIEVLDASQKLPPELLATAVRA